MRLRSFRAMGSEFELFLDSDGDRDTEALLDEAEAEVHRLERMLSRFDARSELSLLNAERTRVVPPELVELVRAAFRARERTHGRFDPTVHDAVVAAGYDRTFDHMRSADAHAPIGPCGGDVEVDEATGRVTLDHDTRLDLGGIAKGWTADRVLARLSTAGPALVNAGGDVACAGKPWPVGVETPTGTFTLELDDGGLATTGRDRRRWTRAGREAHHVIDPATGAPSDGDLLTATASAPTAAEAEVLATFLFLSGDSRRAAAEADAAAVPAVLVTRDGATLLAGGLG